MELAIPGSPVRQASVARQVTNCATWHGMSGSVTILSQTLCIVAPLKEAITSCMTCCIGTGLMKSNGDFKGPGNFKVARLFLLCL